MRRLNFYPIAVFILIFETHIAVARKHACRAIREVPQINVRDGIRTFPVKLHISIYWFCLIAQGPVCPSCVSIFRIIGDAIIELQQ